MSSKLSNFRLIKEKSSINDIEKSINLYPVDVVYNLHLIVTVNITGYIVNDTYKKKNIGKKFIEAYNGKIANLSKYIVVDSPGDGTPIYYIKDTYYDSNFNSMFSVAEIVWDVRYDSYDDTDDLSKLKFNR